MKIYIILFSLFFYSLLQNSLSQSDGLIVGSWTVVPNSVNLEGERVQRLNNFDPDNVRMDIKSLGGIKYRVMMRIINRLSFDIEETVTAWKKKGQVFSTQTESDGIGKKMENKLRKLCENPDFVLLKGNRMMISKGNSGATFVRI